MKKYRCPHCGEKVFTSSQYNFIKLVNNYPSIFIEDYYDVLYCSACSQPSVFAMAKQSRRFVENILTVGIIISLVFAMFSLLISIYLGVALLILLLFEIAFQIFVKSKRFLLPCKKEHDSYIVALPLSNCRVEFNDTKHLKAYGTYAIKFKEETNDLHFKEAFPDGLVPIQLYQKIGDSLQFEARLINKKFVSSELLYDGAKFLIEDFDGIFVAKGTFIKAYFEDEFVG